jgi:hypothetical protein
VPLQKLQFRPGVIREGTSLANEGGWYDCDKVRFRFGFPEKIGGWSVLSYATFQGICRSLWNWITLKQYNLMGVGTELKFYVENGGTYYDITPIRSTVTLNGPFTAIDGSTSINVSDPAHGAINNDFVTFSGAVSLGGNITAAVLNQEFQITYVDSDNYTITTTVAANASDVGDGGAAVVAAYQLNNGTTYGTFQVGWGAGLWGGVVSGASITQLNGAVDNAVTTITVDSTAAFPATGTIAIDSELIAYSGKTATDFTGCTRGASGTVAASHLDNTFVFDTQAYSGWGQSAATSSGTQLRLWSQSNYGEDLLFSPRGGSLYLWQPGSGLFPAFSTRGVVISTPNCPSQINEVLISDATRIVIAFGCNDYEAPLGTGEFDPMLVRWSAQEDYNDWTPSATNQAGSYRLSHGSEIIGSLQTRQEINIWTDSAMYAMQYLGPPFVWGFSLLADNVSVASMNAMTTASGVTYWMGTDKFYVYSGRVETLPCTVRKYVYDDINRDQFSQIFAGTNEGYSEIWWFYCSANSSVIDRYVIYNYLEKVWYYGTMGRTAWLDSPLRDYPTAATTGNLLVYHEAAVDDGTTNPPSPIAAYIQSSDFDIGDGHNYGFVWRMVPDITFDGSTTPSPLFPRVTFTMRPKQNPGSAYTAPVPDPTVTTPQSYSMQSTYNVQEFTQLIFTRVRGRQMAFRIDSNSIGTQWQLGSPRLDVRNDGRR